MNCHCCQSNEVKKSGRFSNKNFIVQRYQCNRCGKTFSDKQPLDGLRTDFKQSCQVIHLLCEGVGIRAISRLTRLDQKTVLRILETAGEKCARLLDEKIRNVKSSFVQVDEIHGFVYSKPQNTGRTDEEHGEFFTYLSLDRDSKLIINWRTAKRNGENSSAFMLDLKNRMDGRFQLTTDALNDYHRGNGAVRKAFGDEIDYATETKIYGKTQMNVSRYFNPLVVVGIKRQRKIGNADLEQATTCHLERMNLSLRIFNRRFTRKTLGYSKKLENLRHSVAIFVAHFNFVRKHSTHGQTPAQAARLTDHQWTIEEMLAETN
jgi:transposase-like protein